jgi:hypothetical protein
VLRFHLPLIEPDVRISRIRLSDKIFTLSPTQSWTRKDKKKTRKAAMWELNYSTSARTAIPSARGGF